MTGIDGSGVVEVNAWKPARKFPQTYPGDRPPTSYLLLDERVHPMEVGPDGELHVLDAAGRAERLATVLRAHAAPKVEHRYRVLAYGANRNPATLQTKLQNYCYLPGDSTAVALPALRATVPAADVVACGLHGQGYFYGDLLINTPATAGTHVEAWILLLDADQLRVLNDSEGVRTGVYSAGLVDVSVDGTASIFSALCYAANQRVLTSPAFGTPLAFRAVEASGRTFPSMTPMEMLDHFVEVYGLAPELTAITGIPSDDGLGAALMKYLNGQWWYAFNTGDTPLDGYARVLETFSLAVAPDSLPLSTAAQLTARGRLLSAAEAYAPAAVSGPLHLQVS